MEEIDAEDWSPYIDVIPSTEMPHFGICVASSIDSDGTPHVHWKWVGDVQVLHMVGTLMSAAFEIMHTKLHNDEDE